MTSPYLNHYYDKRDRYASGQYDGYQYMVNRYRMWASRLYRLGVWDGERQRRKLAKETRESQPTVI